MTLPNHAALADTFNSFVNDYVFLKCFVHVHRHNDTIL